MYQKKSADDQPQSIGEISNQLTMVIDQVKNFGEDEKNGGRRNRFAGTETTNGRKP
ncbi:hypothetical protein [Klebsiella pneumoniae]|uniref:hypothetical protein n=1 Tax=Klebsiella pneumoniae TaxID=573 RepID=UPI002164E09F|nr:hypothetical protein [Klebsiella pneumoniae]